MRSYGHHWVHNISDHCPATLCLRRVRLGSYRIVSPPGWTAILTGPAPKLALFNQTDFCRRCPAELKAPVRKHNHISLRSHAELYGGPSNIGSAWRNALRLWSAYESFAELYQGQFRGRFSDQGSAFDEGSAKAKAAGRLC